MEAENPSRRIGFSQLQESPFVAAAYKGVTPRTFIRELTRLAELGFIKLSGGTTPKSLAVELDFGAIAKYRVY